MSRLLKLPPGQTVLDVADASRLALEQFLILDSTDKVAVTNWLVGPYHRAVADIPKRVVTLAHGEVGGSELSAIVTNAQLLLERAIAAANKPGAEALLAFLPPGGVDVITVEDEHGARGFAPTDVAHTKLGARVLSLLLADYLTRPADYVVASEITRARPRPNARLHAPH